MLEQFLEFLAEDMRQCPQRIRAVSPMLVNYLRSLTADVEIDLNLPLLDEDE
ncbi:MAG: type II toxin-antitoxin system PrlF family antitoxin [Phormidium tanganyikae FI6-MK23]|nr:type II toxin-antitoxin system PrlF family antitoxin [Phormidium tanganyikae FI6-MK23]